MQILVAVVALLLLAVVLGPLGVRRFRLARRERAVHLDGGCHWYANYDEDLRYEPQSRADIVRLRRDELLDLGYRATEEVQIVPRTFRHRVPGDVKIRLWRSAQHEARPLWLCEWAMKPVRVAIGVGEREKVPGVESGRVPVRPGDAPEPPPTIDALGWSEEPGDSVPVSLEPATPNPFPGDRVQDADARVVDESKEAVATSAHELGTEEAEPDLAEAGTEGGDSGEPRSSLAGGSGRKRSGRRRRRG